MSALHGRAPTHAEVRAAVLESLFAAAPDGDAVDDDAADFAAAMDQTKAPV